MFIDVPGPRGAALKAGAILIFAISISGGGQALAAPCARNDSTCLKAEAKAAEDRADQLLKGLGSAPAPGPTPAPPKAKTAAPIAPKAAPAAPGPAGGRLADGEYDCGGGYTYRAMGKVDIRGGTYRYRPYDEVVGGFQPYAVNGRAIVFAGKFGGLDDPPAKIASVTVEPFGFNVNYQGSPGALINTMSCHAPGK